jgi:hypothetical protein
VDLGIIVVGKTAPVSALRSGSELKNPKWKGGVNFGPGEKKSREEQKATGKSKKIINPFTSYAKSI